jgi:hypothetical protein
VDQLLEGSEISGAFDVTETKDLANVGIGKNIAAYTYSQML